ncbi:MAG: acyl-CoA dehydratase activase [Thermodesulfobacteriota bacterium]
MTARGNTLGIDIGSVSLAAAEVTPRFEVVRTFYRIHDGDPKGCLKEMLAGLNWPGLTYIAATSATPEIIAADRRYDGRAAVMAAVRRLFPQAASILTVGGEKFGLILLDGQGRYLNYRTNTSCAAGTGSFLDQQARRLGLSGSAELARLAGSHEGPIPQIATRCAVFAKTDLAHAQQEGYSLSGICLGLCQGLARNIVDTLFSGQQPEAPLLITGGVARNPVVVKYIQELSGLPAIVDESGCLAAVGTAGLGLKESEQPEAGRFKAIDDLFLDRPKKKKYFHPPLVLEKSEYPDFSLGHHYKFTRADFGAAQFLEVDLYEPLAAGRSYRVYLGLDIGSTSTKAVVLDGSRTVLAGFYTRTAGRPLRAVQLILAGLDDLFRKSEAVLEVLGAGTTGAGRKLIGRIIGSDLVLDEITAHARAALDLNPEVDTIIEIGGQDSKFTTLENGRVVFSVMNQVCAAGTGSFIEELAEKLGCPLSEYNVRTEGRRAPLASDRCTVFMERDINHLLQEGYSVSEVLATVLHSVRENYLTKVAVEKNLGRTILFQGATAKNKALVAAFEQRLGRPIHVSKYCHLTGALGLALILAEESPNRSRFRGVGLHAKEIPVRSETCQLCANHCKLTVAEVEGMIEAYGFLCGRDYETKKRLEADRSGFDPLKARVKTLARPGPSRSDGPVIGLPTALYMAEDLPFWNFFFDRLGVRTLTADDTTQALKQGKRLAGAEFCAPMLALHGQVEQLLEKADGVFLPVYLEKRTGRPEVRREYCYYSQYAAALGSGLAQAENEARLMRPLIRYLYPDWHTYHQIHRAFPAAIRKRLNLGQVARAWREAQAFQQAGLKRLKEIYRRETEGLQDPFIVLLGRPYILFSPANNKGLPAMFGRLGLKTFFQDMVGSASAGQEDLRPLLEDMHWHYGAQVLETAGAVALTRGAYPVYVTSFKCTPDSITLEYFKKLMAAHAKPYLVIQLDDHDSSLGYETRIEAAVRSFRNHYSLTADRKPMLPPGPFPPAGENHLAGKTIFLPNWDNLTLNLIAANLRRGGLDVKVLQPDETSLEQSLRHNTGQCLPLNIIVEEFIHQVQTQDLDPGRTVLWVAASTMACNLAQFPRYCRHLLEARGRGFERAMVYPGQLSFMDLSLKFPLNTYWAIMFGSLIRKMVHRLRPYEKIRGAVDRVASESLEIMLETFLGHGSKEKAVDKVVSLFETVETTGRPRPKVAVFGDLYVLDNEYLNQDLVRFIEANGGEAVCLPYNYYLKMIARPYIRKWLWERHYGEAVSSRVLLAVLERLEKKYYRYFQRVLKSPAPVFDEPPGQVLARFGVRIENTGESMENMLKVYYLKREHPDLALFVQASPAFCCPSLVTEAMARRIMTLTDIPVVSLCYDGTAGNKNEALLPYLMFPRTA